MNEWVVKRWTVSADSKSFTLGWSKIEQGKVSHSCKVLVKKLNLCCCDYQCSWNNFDEKNFFTTNKNRLNIVSANLPLFEAQEEK